MTLLRTSAERHIEAAPERVYRAIADHENEHHRYLPPAIHDYRVEQGGMGAGTVISVKVTILGRTEEILAEIEDPEPGRVITETDTRSGGVTTFTVTPNGTGCLVRIETVWEGASGVAGIIERLLAPRALRRVFDDELRRMDAYVRATPS